MESCWLYEKSVLVERTERGAARQLLFLTGCTITQYLQVLYTKPS
jgi:hypothetical protein